MPVTVLWTTRDWASALAGPPADGPLPCRTALVPRGRVAHALRRELSASIGPTPWRACGSLRSGWRPHLFLLGSVLGLDDPASAPSQRDIGQPAYGALLHLVVQEFYQAHGASSPSSG